MKQNLVIFLGLLLSVPVLALDKESLLWWKPDCTIYRVDNTCMLSANSNLEVLHVHYAGHSICSLTMTAKPKVSSTALAELINAYSISMFTEDKKLVPELSCDGEKIVFGLGKTPLYLGLIAFETNSGESIDAVVKKVLGENHSVVIEPIACSGKNE